MLLVLWNYLKGYVIIKVTGFSVERFLNLTAVKDVFVWDICSGKTGAVMKIRLSAIGEAEKCAVRTGCEIEVMTRKGLPFFIRRFKGRQVFAAGAVLFAAVFYALSFFVWSVEYTGCDRVNREKVERFCREKGLYPGALKAKTDMKALSEELIENFDDILWVSIETDGTKAYVRVVETIKEPEMADRETPADIVAAKDGVILSIAASSGTPKVRAGDVVAAGDLIIASEMEIKEGDEVKGYIYTKANGSVMAKVVYELTSYEPVTAAEKHYTGEELKDTAFIIGRNTVNVFKPTLDGKLFDTLVSDGIKLKIGDYDLPAGIKKYEYRIYYEDKKTLTEQEVKALLDGNIEGQLEDITELGALVLDMEKTYINEGNGIRLNAAVTVSEDICRQSSDIRRNAAGGNE